MLAAYIRHFPMTPLGGAFILPVGICIILGAVLPRARMWLVVAGFALGIVAVSVAASHWGAHVPPVHRFAIYSIFLAIGVEVPAFVIVMPRVRPQGARAAGLASLMIVGAHFLT